MSLPVTRLNHHHDGSQLQRVWLAACSLCCDTLSPEPGKRELPRYNFSSCLTYRDSGAKGCA